MLGYFSFNETEKQEFACLLDYNLDSIAQMLNACATVRIGDEMPDGTIYAGISPDTYRDMYAMPPDAPLTYTFNQAKKYAAKLDAHGHQDWRVPTKGELNVLFQNQADIGGFDSGGSEPAGWYWSSSQRDYYIGWVQSFSDGTPSIYSKHGDSSLRCIRG